MSPGAPQRPVGLNPARIVVGSPITDQEDSKSAGNGSCNAQGRRRQTIPYVLVRCEQCTVVRQVPPEVIRKVLDRCPTFFESETDRSQVALVCRDCGQRYRIVSLEGNRQEERLCADCGRPICLARIQAQPEAVRCVVCQERVDSKLPGQLERTWPICLRWCR